MTLLKRKIEIFSWLRHSTFFPGTPPCARQNPLLTIASLKAGACLATTMSSVCFQSMLHSHRNTWEQTATLLVPVLSVPTRHAIANYARWSHRHLRHVPSPN